MSTRRDRMLEERRRARGTKAAPPPPKVTPITGGGPTTSKPLRPSSELAAADSHLASNATASSSFSTSDLNNAALREELSRRAGGVGASGGSGDVRAAADYDHRPGMSMSGSAGHDSASGEPHPMFEDMVAAEMQRMEREFRKELRQDQLQDSGPISSHNETHHQQQQASYAEDFADQGPASPPPRQPVPHRADEAGSHRSLGFGRGLHGLFEGGDGDNAAPSLPGGPRSSHEQQQSRGRRGFGQGLHSLYESPEDAYQVRQKQQAYARALSEQLHDRTRHQAAASPTTSRAGGYRGATGVQQEDKENRWRSPLSSPTRNGGGMAEHTGLLIGGRPSASLHSTSPGRRRRQNPGLERMYADPEELQHKILDQREYAKALEQQMAEKQQQQRRRRQEEEQQGWALPPSAASMTSPSPSRRASAMMMSSTGQQNPITGHRPLLEALSPKRPGAASSHSMMTSTGPLPMGRGGVQSSADKKAAYAAALREQIMENEERRRREKEARRVESGLSPAMPQQQQPQLSPVGGARWMPAPDSGRRRQPSHDHHDVPPPLPHQHTPRRALDFNHATDAAAMATPSPSQPPPAMTEARRRLVRDVYGSNTSPWATMPAAPSPAAYQPPAGAPAAAPLSLSSSAFTSSLPAPPQASPYDLPSPVMGGGGPPVKASFVKHGALAYDPNVQQTLMAKHQAALQQREALERQMEEKRKAKESLLAKQKQEEEIEVRRMLEESERAAAELENERRKKVEAEQKVQLEAQQEQRRRETDELKAELAHLQHQRAALEAAGVSPPPPPHLSSPQRWRAARHELEREEAAAMPHHDELDDGYRPPSSHREQQPQQRPGSGRRPRPQEPPKERDEEEERELWGNLVRRSPQRRQSVFNQQQPRRRASTGGGGGYPRPGEEAELRSRSVPYSQQDPGLGLEEEDPLEQSLATESRFISLTDESSPAQSGSNHLPSRRFPSPTRASNNGGSSSRSPYRRSGLHRPSVESAPPMDEMDVFVEQWQRSHGLAAVNRPPPANSQHSWRSRLKGGYRPGAAMAAILSGSEGKGRRGGVEDSLSSDSTFMMLTDEERQRAETEAERAEREWMQRQQQQQQGGSSFQPLSVSVPSTVMEEEQAATPVSPLTELLRNHQEIHADKEALEDLRKQQPPPAQQEGGGDGRLFQPASPPRQQQQEAAAQGWAGLPAGGAVAARSPVDEYGDEGFEDEDAAHSPPRGGQAGGGVLGDISARWSNNVGGPAAEEGGGGKTTARWQVPATESERAKLLEAIR